MKASNPPAQSTDSGLGGRLYVKRASSGKMILTIASGPIEVSAFVEPAVLEMMVSEARAA